MDGGLGDKIDTTFGLRNVGSVACEIVGYPGVQLVDGTGKPIFPDPGDGTDPSQPPIALKMIILAPQNMASLGLNGRAMPTVVVLALGVSM